MTQSGRISSFINPILEIWRQTDRDISLRVYGNSMNPLIRAGDRISLRLMGAAHLKKGDIIAFKEGEKLVVHRLIKKKMVNGRYWFCQKGDNLRGWSWIPENQMAGKVKSIKRSGGTLDLARWPWPWTNHILGFALFFWIGAYEKARALKIFIFGPRA